MSTTKTAVIAVVGRPNVGKSTLTNALVGEKVAIVSNKPQTTRSRITGVLTRGEDQFILLDTPGLHRARTRLGDYMVNVARRSVADVDGVLLLVEPIPNIGPPERELIDRIKEQNLPAVLVVNKVDTIVKESLFAVMEVYGAQYDWAAILPMAAKTGEGTDALMQIMRRWLVPGPWLFPDDMTSDQPESVMCAEIVREKLLWCLEREVPHGTAVEVEKFAERENGIIDLHVVIFCEKDSHKGIIIGKRGETLKKIATMARQDIERFMGGKVYLQCFVKVRPNWRDSATGLRALGYKDE